MRGGGVESVEDVGYIVDKSIWKCGSRGEWEWVTVDNCMGIWRCGKREWEKGVGRKKREKVNGGGGGKNGRVRMGDWQRRLGRGDWE